ncbi:AAA-ATPase ASD, mitochondrial-like [Magnolia sinica]|uniref:AAA-ATPase ASD, mitochondrial-like n=1 Tax=Magnolia sinica TaxID=86752 RepID=UPI002658C6A1|nr:AAA-ATPase ASD, mitochondrial-like [Magnolia sinica]
MMEYLWPGVGSTLASLMLFWAVVQRYLPFGLDDHLMKYTNILIGYIYPYIQIKIPEYTGHRMKRSDVYIAIQTYLTATTSGLAKRLKAEMGKDTKNLTYSMDDYEQVTDKFRGAKVWWSSNRSVSQSLSISWYPAQEEPRYYTLTFHRRHRQLIMDYYMSHVVEEGKAIGVRNRQRKLYTNNPSSNWDGYKKTVWSHVVFEHPATFDTLAMDPEKKQEIKDDLETFREAKDYYVKIGKAWKRGYLLYGPPGTGKSTMIVAMANFLDYDVYDLELTAVKDNTELRKLLIDTSSKSIMVIEDIDCSLDLSGKRKKKAKKSEDNTDEKKLPPGADKDDSTSKVTLSGLLNFIDGLWSACGGERIIVFTTNHLEKLDPALIRRGRMDKHIELSYCSFEAFKVLAKNYLDLDSHPLFKTVQQLIEEINITPADVAENLMPKSSKATAADKANTCLENLIQALHKAREVMKSKEAAVQLEETGSGETAKVDKDDAGSDKDDAGSESD